MGYRAEPDLAGPALRAAVGALPDDLISFECLSVSSHVYLDEFIEDAKRMPVNCHRVAG